MITGWLFKIVASFVLVGLLVVEIGSPLVARAQIDGVAHDAADSAALELLDHNDVERARAVAQEIADDNDVVLEVFTVDQRGLRVTVMRKAWSLVLKKWDKTKTWYDVRVTATARTAKS
ncbi:MAG TPA: hypothetical protein VHM89_09245 [Acidimicrobiales bacterium]|nr:hypothetical protein [Acidimicrobiales bacterium]